MKSLGHPVQRSKSLLNVVNELTEWSLLFLYLIRVFDYFVLKDN